MKEKKQTKAKTNKQTKNQANCDGKHCWKQNKTFNFT